MRVLLIDESAADCTKLALTLNQQGMEAAATHHVEQAMEFLISRHVDLILSDVLFTEKSSLVLGQLLKADAKLAKIPVIFFHKPADTELKEALTKLGYQHFLPKPISRATVMPLIRQIFPVVRSISRSATSFFPKQTWTSRG